MVSRPSLRVASEIPDDMQRLLSRYWGRDQWDFADPFFDPFLSSTAQPTSIKHTRRGRIDFVRLPEQIKNELKFYLASRLESQRLALSSTRTYFDGLYHLADFLAAYYPDISSFSELPFETVLLQWSSFVDEHKKTTRKKSPCDSYNKYFKSPLKQILIFFNRYYDNRDECEKDEWDLRKIPGVKLMKAYSMYRLRFEVIPPCFRMLVKRYMKVRVARQISPTSCWQSVHAIGNFLDFIHQQHPDWLDLAQLSRRDVENYLVWAPLSKSHGARQKRAYLSGIRMFLDYMQQAQYTEAPTTPVVLLIHKEDIPREPKPSDETIKYIPENVLQQLETQLEHLDPAGYTPIVVLLRASGWRISDILNLRYHTCLDRTDLGWYLCGDITKTQVLGHRIPITNEVAVIAQAVIEETREKSTPDNNPDKFLFVRTRGRRKGLPPKAGSVADALNRLAQRSQIVDLQGQVFRFGNHAFRHTKAVELINNGMSLLHVQKWLAHYSPEMTLIYARLLDSTLREEWERVVQQELFRFDTTGKPSRVQLSELANEDIIEWEYIRTHLDAVRVPLGYCMKPLKMPCGTQQNPCTTCPFLCTTQEFLPEFEHHIQDTQAMIDRGKALGRTTWVEKNQTALIRLESITRVLRDGKTHHKAGKQGREYERGGQEHG